MSEGQRRATYAQMKRALSNLLYDLEILSGDYPGNGSTWQDVAGTAAVSAEVLSRQLRQAHEGNHESFIVFPSPADCIEANAQERMR